MQKSLTELQNEVAANRQRESELYFAALSGALLPLQLSEQLRQLDLQKQATLAGLYAVAKSENRKAVLIELQMKIRDQERAEELARMNQADLIRKIGLEGRRIIMETTKYKPSYMPWTSVAPDGWPSSTAIDCVIDWIGPETGNLYLIHHEAGQVSRKLIIVASDRQLSSYALGDLVRVVPIFVRSLTRDALEEHNKPPSDFYVSAVPEVDGEFVIGQCYSAELVSANSYQLAVDVMAPSGRKKRAQVAYTARRSLFGPKIPKAGQPFTVMLDRFHQTNPSLPMAVFRLVVDEGKGC